ncbi:hypothetical protein CHU95_10195 [Niveispirillum lacus]|uniref:Esterase n=1 Tax=Niveispirillum lacus TaxID=1981099 RepID=A0A255Z0F5_9PROT|nr:alpha/beta hydrolase-fold protein [Niveispirillum lacus]OYQ34938.1 hypothetical protein CHU95_10195 [Niveispirillum lacus]
MRLAWILAAALLFPAAASQAQETLQAYQVERSSVLTVTSAQNGRTYDLYIKLPPGYADPKNAGKRYGVLYLTDGDYTFQVASGITRLAHNLKRLEEFILVGLPTAKGEDGMVSRRRDLTPWSDPELPGVSGGAAAYLGFLVKEAMPLVEKTYRIDPTRRTLVGQSYGGLFGLWVLFTQPQHFSSYILTSPSIWYKDYALATLEADYARAHKDLRARVYMATGSFEAAKPGDKRYNQNRDMVADQQEMAKRLRSRQYPGLQVVSEVSPGTYHETTFPVGLIQGMQWLYPAP